MTTIDETRITDPEEIERILEERAVALAQSTDDEAHGEHITFVIVRLGSERYAMPIDCVREIKPLDRVTALSATPPFWLGLANLRGNLHPVLDLRRYLGVQSIVESDEPQLVLVSGDTLTIGLRVDQVVEVRAIATSEIGPSLVERTAERADIHTGLTRDLICVLDIEELLADRALIVQDVS